MHNNKVKRLRAGQVPQWAFNQQQNPATAQQQDKIKYSGVTGDGAGIVLDIGTGEDKDAN